MSEAYTIAQTVYYDNEHLQLEQYPMQKNQPRQQKMPFMGYHNQNPWNNNNQNPWNNNNQNPWNNQGKNYNKPEPMEIDCSNRIKTNWHQPQQQVYGQKREYNSSRQRFEQPQKMQRINRLTNTTQPIPEDQISNASNESTHTNVSSAFLGE